MDEGFLRAVLTQPDDDLPRLVYADYLDERGDPRGEFIRTQISLSRGVADPALTQRERDLLSAYGPQWLGPLADIVTIASYRRGFIEDVVIVTDQYLKNENLLFNYCPIRRIKFRGVLGHERALARSKALSRLMGIDLGYNDLDAGQLQPLIDSPEISRLRELTIAGNLVGDRGATCVAFATHLTKLRHLDVEGCKITQEGLVRLQLAPHLRRLESFACFDNPIGNTGVRILCDMEVADRLRVLDLSNTDIDDIGLDALTHRSWPKLERLDLGYNRLTGRTLDRFGHAARFPALVYVGLHGNAIAETTVEQFLETPLGRQLTAFGYSLDTASENFGSRLRARFEEDVY